MKKTWEIVAFEIHWIAVAYVSDVFIVPLF